MTTTNTSSAVESMTNQCDGSILILNRQGFLGKTDKMTIKLLRESCDSVKAESVLVIGEGTSYQDNNNIEFYIQHVIDQIAPNAKIMTNVKTIQSSKAVINISVIDNNEIAGSWWPVRDIATISKEKIRNSTQRIDLFILPSSGSAEFGSILDVQTLTSGTIWNIGNQCDINISGLEGEYNVDDKIKNSTCSFSDVSKSIIDEILISSEEKKKLTQKSWIIMVPNDDCFFPENNDDVNIEGEINDNSNQINKKIKSHDLYFYKPVGENNLEIHTAPLMI